MRYPGGKNLTGVYQRIINQIPPHDWYIEPFAGSAAICRRIRPAERITLIDLDKAALGRLAGRVPAHAKLIRTHAVEWLDHSFHVQNPLQRAFIYADPTYVPSACLTPLRYPYFLSEQEHDRLLCILLELPALVAISGYNCRLYDRRLKDWRRIDYQVMTRGGYPVTESLWCNYAEPKLLHDPRYVGQNYRQREDLARMKARWLRKFAGLDGLKRQALLAAIAEAGLLHPRGGTGGNAGAVPTGVSAVDSSFSDRVPPATPVLDPMGDRRGHRRKHR